MPHPVVHWEIAGKDGAKSIDHENAGTAMKGRSETENRVEGTTA